MKLPTIHFTPHIVAVAALAIGVVLAVIGVLVLFGAGWALIVAAIQAQVFGLLLLRGLNG